MLPGFTQYCTANCGLRYTISPSQLLLAYVAVLIVLAYSLNIFTGQAARSAWSGFAAASLLAHIIQVLSLCTSEQMRGIATGRIVACMAGYLVGLHWTIFCKLNGNPMCACLFSLPAARAKDAISTARLGTGPCPAGIGAARPVNMFPEAFGQTGTWRQGTARAAGRGTVALTIHDSLELCFAGWAGRLRVHIEAPFRCVAPRATAIAPGHFHAFIIP